MPTRRGSSPAPPWTSLATNFYLACLDLEGRRCLVVGGGGGRATRRRRVWSQCGAASTVVSPELDESFADLDVEWLAAPLPHGRPRRSVPRDRRHLGPGRVNRGSSRRGAARATLQRRRRARALQLHPPRGAPRGPDRGRRLDRAARRPRSPSACARRSPSWSTPEHADLAEELRALRPEVKERFATYEERRDYFEESSARGSDDGQARDGLARRRRPGRPGLITARGLELVRSCDALVYDVLVSPELVAEAPDDALLIPREEVRQAELNKLLVELGREGLEVVRLKGGDPFVFGRGGEEAEALAAAGVAVRGRARRLGAVGRAGVGRHPGHAPRSRRRR